MFGIGIYLSYYVIQPLLQFARRAKTLINLANLKQKPRSKISLRSSIAFKLVITKPIAKWHSFKKLAKLKLILNKVLISGGY